MDILDRINQAINNGVTGEALMPLLKESRSELQATRRALADTQAEAKALRDRVSELELKAAAAGAASTGGADLRGIKAQVGGGGVIQTSDQAADVGGADVQQSGGGAQQSNG